MKSRLMAAVLFATLAAAGAAQADPIDFKPGAVGTRYYLSSGGYLEINQVSGKSVHTVNSVGNPFDWVTMFVGLNNASTYQFNKEKAESIWPLEIGKKVQFDFSGSGSLAYSSGTWTNELRVLRAETLKTEAGVFDTIVVEWYERGIQGAGLGFIGTTTYWYAPKVGFFVKRVFSQQTGGGNRVTAFEVNRVVPPR